MPFFNVACCNRKALSTKRKLSPVVSRNDNPLQQSNTMHIKLYYNIRFYRDAASSGEEHPLYGDIYWRRSAEIPVLSRSQFHHMKVDRCTQNMRLLLVRRNEHWQSRLDNPLKCLHARLLVKLQKERSNTEASSTPLSYFVHRSKPLTPPDLSHGRFLCMVACLWTSIDNPRPIGWSIFIYTRLGSKVCSLVRWLPWYWLTCYMY